MVEQRLFSRAHLIKIDPQPMSNLKGMHRISSGGGVRGGDGDVFLGRLLKLIPGEALVIYPIGKAAAENSQYVSYWPLVVLLVVIALRVFTTRDKGKGAQSAAIVISCITYFIWVLANGDSFGPISLKFDDANIFLVWAGVIWMAVSSKLYKGD